MLSFSSRTTKKKGKSPQQESQLSRYQLDAPTTEPWDTRGERGHKLGSYLCDKRPAITAKLNISKLKTLIVKQQHFMDESVTALSLRANKMASKC